ncbi:MAG: hypothetical protein IH987_07870, partial [Planctomycetes bacterium]|nr:hypothetical protein [Planctomycetota bacterium]
MNSHAATKKTTAIGPRRHSLMMTLMLTTLLSAANAGTAPEPPIRAAAPHDILKNRYISIDPRGASGTNPAAHHVRVALDSSQVPDLITAGPWWATSPQNGGGLSPATCISVVSTLKPASAPDWTGCPTVHLTGCPIIPTTTYRIQAEVDGTLSAGTLLDTQAKPGDRWFGDIVGRYTGPNGSPPNVWTAPNGVVNIDDAYAGIKTLNNPLQLSATHLSVADTHPVLNGTQINRNASINDELIVILGLQGKTYGQVADPHAGIPPNIPDLTE